MSTETYSFAGVTLSGRDNRIFGALDNALYGGAVLGGVALIYGSIFSAVFSGVTFAAMMAAPLAVGIAAMTAAAPMALGFMVAGAAICGLTRLVGGQEWADSVRYRVSGAASFLALGFVISGMTCLGGVSGISPIILKSLPFVMATVGYSISSLKKPGSIREDEPNVFKGLACLVGRVRGSQKQLALT